MCMSSPKMPKMPEAPPPAPAPPPPAPMIEPEKPLPPPESVPQGNADAAKIKKRATKRQQMQQAASGASALRIPLNTGSAGGAAAKAGGGLNIPT